MLKKIFIAGAALIVGLNIAYANDVCPGNSFDDAKASIEKATTDGVLPAGTKLIQMDAVASKAFMAGVIAKFGPPPFDKDAVTMVSVAQAPGKDFVVIGLWDKDGCKLWLSRMDLETFQEIVSGKAA